MDWVLYISIFYISINILVQKHVLSQDYTLQLLKTQPGHGGCNRNSPLRKFLENTLKSLVSTLTPSSASKDRQ